MRRIACLLLALMMCMMVAMPVFAATDTFVPSISYKDGPDVEDATMGDEDVTDCIVVTSLKEAKEKTTDIGQDDRDLLWDVYNKLSKGTMELKVDSKKYVVRELVDVSFRKITCHEDEHTHDPELEQPEVTATVKFDLGVPKNIKVRVFTYNDGVWNEVKDVTNNGDGTVTCVFDHFCPVAFCVEVNAVAESPKTGDQIAAMILWVVLLIVSAVALVVLLVLRKKKK